jgi:hypothetical protein
VTRRVDILADAHHGEYFGRFTARIGNSPLTADISLSFVERRRLANLCEPARSNTGAPELDRELKRPGPWPGTSWFAGSSTQNLNISDPWSAVDRSLVPPEKEKKPHV